MRDFAGSLLSRLIDRPLLATPTMARHYLAYLASREGLRGVLIENDRSADLQSLMSGSNYSYRLGQSFAEVPDTGIAVIEVIGSLTHRLGQIHPHSGMTGYDGVERKLQDALKDKRVRGIVLDIHSHGGEVSGCFDLADKLYAARAAKPIWAIVNEAAYSAAYCLASQASRIVTTRTGGSGSIGVVLMHADYSQALAQEGVDITLIHAGAHKVDGNPFQPLPEDVRDRLQREVNDAYGIFASTVSRGTGLKEAAIRGTEAQCFTALEALQLKLVHAIQPSSDTFAEFATYLKSGKMSSSFADLNSARVQANKAGAVKTSGPKPSPAPAPAPFVVMPSRQTISTKSPAPAAKIALPEEPTRHSTAAEISSYAKAHWDAKPGLRTEFGEDYGSWEAYVRAFTRGGVQIPVGGTLAGNHPAHAPTNIKSAREEWNASPALRQEFRDNYQAWEAFHRAQASGRARVHGSATP